jgi:ABC-2 type transport system permease protein
MRELLRYRDLIGALISRDLRVRYRRSVIGFLWTMLHPLLTMAVLTVVFSYVFRFNVENYPVYALTGVLFWNFFSQGITASMNSLRGNAALLTKLPVPKAVFPVATVLSGLVNLVFALVPMLLIVGMTGHAVTPAILFLPVAILVAATFTLGAGLFLSPLAAFFTDIVEMVGILLGLLMYLTPVFYPVSILPDEVRWIVQLNPVRSVLELFRTPIYAGQLPSPLDLAVAVGIAVAVLAVGALVFRRSSSRIPLYL